MFMHPSLQDVLVKLTELSNVEQTIKLLQILKDNTAELLNDGKARKVMCSLLLQVAEFSGGEKSKEQREHLEELQEVFLEICQSLKGDVENVLVVKTVLQILSGHVNMSAKDIGMSFNAFQLRFMILVTYINSHSLILFSAVKIIRHIELILGIKRHNTTWNYTPPTEFIQTFHEMCEEIFSLDDIQGKNFPLVNLK